MRRAEKLFFVALVLGAFLLGSFGAQSTWADDNQNGLAPFTSDWDNTTKTGTPLFQFGWWANDADQSHATPDGVSTNIVFNGPTQISFTQAVLDSAQANGIKMMVGIHRVQALPQLVPGSNGDFQNFVNRFKDHPALAGWIVGEENSSFAETTPTLVSAAITELRLLDPNHQVFQVFSHVAGMAPILPYLEDVVTMQPNTDAMAFDYYRWFIGEPEFGGVDASTGKARPKDYLTKLNDMANEALSRSMAMGISLQGWGGGNGGSSLEAHRYGTANELRWYTFAAMASAGARQISLWDHVDRTIGGDLATFETTVVNPVWAELDMIKNAMETGYNVGNAALSFTPEGGWSENFNEISDLLLYDDTAGAIYVILTHNDDSAAAKSVTVTLSGLPPGMTNMTIPKTSEVIALTDLGGGSYTFTDTLDDYEVNLYKIDYIPGDFDLSGVVDLTDFGILSDHYFSTGNALNQNGELTADGVVDVLDFKRFKEKHYPGGASAFELALAQANSVPEPVSAVLLIAGVSTMVLIGRRRRSEK